MTNNDYQLEKQYFGCKGESELRQVTVQGHPYTLCYKCEQRLVNHVLQGGLL